MQSCTNFIILWMKIDQTFPILLRFIHPSFIIVLFSSLMQNSIFKINKKNKRQQQRYFFPLSFYQYNFKYMHSQLKFGTSLKNFEFLLINHRILLEQFTFFLNINDRRAKASNLSWTQNQIKYLAGSPSLKNNVNLISNLSKKMRSCRISSNFIKAASCLVKIIWQSQHYFKYVFLKDLIQTKITKYQIQIMNGNLFPSKLKQLEDPQYNPSKRKPKKQTLKQKKQAILAKSINQKKMRWTEEQNVKYIKFIEKNMQLFEDQDKKAKGVFFKMALFLKTRNYSQCRSHHQKMMLRYRDIDGILKGESVYKQVSSISRLKGMEISSGQTTFQREKNFDSQLQEHQNSNKEHQIEILEQPMQLQASNSSEQIQQIQQKSVEKVQITKKQQELFNVLNFQQQQ